MLNVIPISSGTVHIYVTRVGEGWDYENIWTWKAGSTGKISRAE